ncbi:hypothetical protein ABEB36_013868 [Hypothenemus hampei]|uniref:D-beta-hydroxybutyrate dehydrogenase, mitochondrial n=1 Tax=Hypothenemus hampei TaxID=57062 RepID=A0ABD1E5R7_HYPHA
MMDEHTAWMLALQLVALFSIASAILLYLICKISTQHSTSGSPGAGKPVIITSCDNAIGLQLAIHLANRGFRVFAGLKNGCSGLSSDSVSAKVIRSWLKHRESLPNRTSGNIVPLHLEVTREDLLHESVDIIRAHLPAGEDGIWAVICTNGVAFRGPLVQQDITHWDAIFKTNVIGNLRVARTFQNLLKNCGGRILNVATTDNLGAGLVAYAASRFAVVGASKALAQELAQYGIKVITLSPIGILPELLFSQSKLMENTQDRQEIRVEIEQHLDFQPKVLSESALDTLDIALTARCPKQHYNLEFKYKWPRQFNLCKRL